MRQISGIVVIKSDDEMLVAPRRPGRSTIVPSAMTSNKL
jgi:hypothetical protein